MICSICSSPDHDKRVHRFGKRGAPKRTNALFFREKGRIKVTPIRLPTDNPYARRDSSGRFIESLEAEA